MAHMFNNGRQHVRGSTDCISVPLLYAGDYATHTARLFRMLLAASEAVTTVLSRMYYLW
jgi:hypothetical protein